MDVTFHSSVVAKSFLLCSPLVLASATFADIPQLWLFGGLVVLNTLLGLIGTLKFAKEGEEIIFIKATMVGVAVAIITALFVFKLKEWVGLEAAMAVACTACFMGWDRSIAALAKIQPFVSQKFNLPTKEEKKK